MANIDLDQVSVDTLSLITPEIVVDNLRVGGIRKSPGSITTNTLRASGIKRQVSSTRFKSGYLIEILAELSAVTGITFDPTKYSLVNKGTDPTDSRYGIVSIVAGRTSGYRRSVDLSYRKLNAWTIADTFDLTQLIPSVSQPLNTTQQIVNRLNSLFGTKFTSLDFIEENSPVGSTRYLNVADTSFYFQSGTRVPVGTVGMSASAYSDVPGLALSETDTTQFSLYTGDFSAYASTLNAIAGTVLTTAQAQSLTDMAQAVFSDNLGLSSSNYLGSTKGLGGAPCTKITLPNTTYVTDASGYYNKALIVTVTGSSNFKCDYLVFHYNG